MQQESSIFSLVNESDYLNSRENDIILWESFLENDAVSFGLLFKRYYPDLFQYGNKICKQMPVLEDSIQELFLDIWKNRNPTPTVSIKAYLIKALKYKLLKELGKNNSQSLPDHQHEQPFDIPHEAFLIAAQDDRERSERLVKALQQLSNRQKEMIYLRFYKDLDYEEISSIMDINYQAARNLLYQAMKSLKKFYSIVQYS